MSASPTILLVDDEEDILELVSYNLERDGYSVRTAATAEAALKEMDKALPDLLLLDVMLPGMSGMDLCKRMKAQEKTRHIPVLLLTARSEETDIVVGLELGADDYITKPFRTRELLARIKAHLRRGHDAPEANGILAIGDITIDPTRRLVTLSGKALDLTYTEFEVLQVLARQPGRVFTRYQIVDAVRGKDYPVTDRSVDVQITGLRKKLGTTEYIDTVRGVGYRFRNISK
jgi:two-component system alkaline phosphatase synthesis response regulator PhoP